MRTVTVAMLVALVLAPAGCDKRPAPLKPIDARHGIYLLRLEIHITVTPAGVLRSVQVENKSYGPGDIDPKNERTEIRQGQLTTAQITQLFASLAGWDALSDKPYPAPADSPEIAIRYGDKLVTGTFDSPKQLSDVDALLRSFAASMPVVKSWTTLIRLPYHK